MMARYSIFSLARNALSYHQDWPEAWRSPEPKPSYEVVIIGGGGHGLATAYYLAKEHAAATAWRPLTIWPRSTASPTSR